MYEFALVFVALVLAASLGWGLFRLCTKALLVLDSLEWALDEFASLCARSVADARDEVRTELGSSDQGEEEDEWKYGYKPD